MLNPLALVGREIMGRCRVAGRACLLFLSSLLSLRHLRRCLIQLRRQFDTAGFGSVTVLALIAALTGMIMAVQTGSELQRFGVLDRLGAIIGATFARELGPIWAAVIVLARVGGAMAAELGTMAVNEEIDALRAMSIDPVRYLVMPRILALMVVMPLLTAIADWVGMAGGALISRSMFGLPLGTFAQSAQSLLHGLDLYSGMAKSVIFGAVIGTIACDQGISTENGAEGVGKATTNTVVLSVVFVLIIDLVMTSFVQIVLKPIFNP